MRSVADSTMTISKPSDPSGTNRRVLVARSSPSRYESARSLGPVDRSGTDVLPSFEWQIPGGPSLEQTRRPAQPGTLTEHGAAMTAAPSAKQEAFLRSSEANGIETPFVVVDLDRVAQRYDALTAALPEADVFYAIKANPAAPVLSMLAKRGSAFDVASPTEIDMALAAGVTADRISFGNTIKKERHIADAFAKGVRLFAFDAEDELHKLTRSAPGSTVFCRVLCDGSGADWPLSRKFGCEPAEARRLLVMAAEAGHQIGVSFHVGSQQKDLTAWQRALAEVAWVADGLHAAGHRLSLVNIGGGFPARYLEAMPSIAQYGDAIRTALRDTLSPLGYGEELRVIAEPGRYMVADAGVMQTEVVLVSRKHEFDDRRWVFLDCGKFGGLAETMDEAIRYRLRTPHDGTADGPVTIAGPTCDSADVLYEKTDYRLPLALTAGDKVELFSCGAYTTTYAAVGFNGFAPLREYFV
jgi:ornithine decarboxylase